MQLKDMNFIKLKRDKRPKEKLNIHHSFESVEFYADLGVKIEEPFVVLDVDDKNEFLKLKELITDKKIKCNIMKSTRGGHFWFRSSKSLTNSVHIKTPLGITVDIRSYGKLCYTKVKHEGKWREWVTNYDFEELDELPFFLRPINHSYELVDMKKGDGRNDKLFSYIIVLNNYMTKEKVRETFYLINEYVLGDKLDYKELETILRDESFENLRPNFFNKSKFLFDRFSTWLITNYNIKKRGGLLYVYHNNSYVCSTQLIEQIMVKHIKLLNKNQRRETLDYLRLVAPDTPEPNKYYILTKNCIVDIRDNTVMEFNKDTFIPSKLNVSYNPQITENEIIDKFMDKITNSDKDVENLIYEMIGYCLLSSVKFQKSFILFGEGSNGKSTLLDMVIELLGDINISSLSLKELNHSFKLAEITDKLANIGDDISDEYITDSSIFKKLVTGEEITVDKKYEQPYKMRNIATLLFATNNLPNMQDKSNGMIRRLCIIPFQARIKPTDPDYDPFIIDKITTDEAKSYVLNKALEGIQRVYINNKFTEPEVVNELMEDYYKEINNVLRFLEHYKNIKGKTSHDVYNDYVFWCSNNMTSAYKIRRVNSEIRNMHNLDLKQKRKNGEVVSVWQ